MENSHEKRTNHYLHLALMATLSFLAMYVLMYSMANSISNVYMSFNQVYMAALMTAPMVAIELVVMRMMYRDASLNRVLIAAAVVVGAAMFLFIRQQTAIGDRQFLRSMIPHHAAAILMCQQASITAPDIRALCEEIKTNQQREVDQMKGMLTRLQ